MSAAVPFRRPETKSEPEKPYRTVRVGRLDYRMVPDEKAPNGFAFFVERGTNAMGEPDWRVSAAPAQRDVLAALFSMLGE